MTVDELIEALEVMSTHGQGALPVMFEDDSLCTAVFWRQDTQDLPPLHPANPKSYAVRRALPNSQRIILSRWPS
jgi:hypothetical protein